MEVDRAFIIEKRMRKKHEDMER